MIFLIFFSSLLLALLSGRVLLKSIYTLDILLKLNCYEDIS